MFFTKRLFICCLLTLALGGLTGCSSKDNHIATQKPEAPDGGKSGSTIPTVRIALTGDLHSHFDPHPAWGGPHVPELERGGYARLATALKMERIKASEEGIEFLYLDAGDVTEGGTLFLDRLGEASWKALEILKPDAVALGNHDWFVGPYELGRVLKSSKLRYPVLAGNLKYSENALDPSTRVEEAVDKFLTRRNVAELFPFDDDQFHDYNLILLELLLVGYKVPNELLSGSDDNILRAAIDELLNLLDYLYQLDPEQSSDKVLEIIELLIQKNILKTRVVSSQFFERAWQLITDLRYDELELPSRDDTFELLKEFILTTPRFRDLMAPIDLLEDQLVRALKEFNQTKHAKAVKGFTPSLRETSFFIRMLNKRVRTPKNQLNNIGVQLQINEFWKRAEKKAWYRQHIVIPQNIASIDFFLDKNNRLAVMKYISGFFAWANIHAPYLTPKSISHGPLLIDSVIIRKGDLNICLLGLQTNEREYKYFMAPVDFESPKDALNRLLSELKKSNACDLIGALTHLTDYDDIKIVEQVEDGLDFIAGGHSHSLFNISVRSKVTGKEIPIIKSGKHGEAFVTFDIELGAVKEVKNFRIIEVTSDYTPDPEMAEYIEMSKESIIGALGFDIFSTLLGRSECSMHRLARVESPLSNFVADAIRDAVGDDVDVVILSPLFIQEDISSGTITSADVFNSIPPIYNPDTHGTWRLYSVDMKGNELLPLLQYVFGQGHILAIDSRGKIVYDPSKLNPFQSFTITKYGKEVEVEDSDSAIYTVAVPEGILLGLLANNELSAESFSKRKLFENDLWGAVANRIVMQSPLNKDNLGISQRLTPVQSDLAIFRKDVTVSMTGSVPGVGGTVMLPNGEVVDIVTSEQAAELSQTEAAFARGMLITLNIQNNGQSDSGPADIIVNIDSTPNTIFDNGGKRFLTMVPENIDDNPNRAERLRLDNFIYTLLLDTPDSMNEIARYKLEESVKANGGTKEVNIYIPEDVLNEHIKSGLKVFPLEILIQSETPEWVSENNRTEAVLVLP